MVELRIMGESPKVASLIETLRRLAAGELGTLGDGESLKVRDVSRQCHNRSGPGVRVYLDVQVGAD